MSNVPVLPGTATLLEDLDSKSNEFRFYYCQHQLTVIYIFQTEKVLVVLRDGRTLIGFLRSVDQFANLVLHRTIERIHVGKEYGDIPRGVFIVRGENVALLGEIVSFPILLYLKLTHIHYNVMIGSGEGAQDSLEAGWSRRDP